MSLSPRSKLNTHDYNVVTKGRLPEVHRFEHLTELARKQGEREIIEANNNVRTEYRKRLQDTKEMKSRMEQCLNSLSVEIGTLERCRNEVLEGLRNFEPNISLSALYTEARKGRPTSPSMYHENVVGAMAQNNTEIRASISRLADAVSQLEDSLAVLRQCQRELAGEIGTQMTTMIIDNACMEELLHASDLVGAVAAQNLKAQSVIKQSSKLHTANEWQNTAESVVSNGFAQIEVSQTRRKKALSALRTIKEAGKYNRNPLVLDAFQARMRYNQGQLASLDLNLQMITGQIDQLDKQKALVIGSLEKTLQQQDIAKQRLTVRALLPSKENTRPNVEATLEVELANLERNEREFRNKLGELEKNLVTQMALRTSMKHEHKARTDAFHLDKACFEMRLPSLSNEMIAASASSMGRILGAATSNQGSSSSSRGSTRASQLGGAGVIPRPPYQAPPSDTYDERGCMPSSGDSGRSAGKASGRSQLTTGGYGVKAAPTLPPIPSPPSPRTNRQSSDVEALLRTGTPNSARSGRSGSVRSSRR